MTQAAEWGPSHPRSAPGEHPRIFWATFSRKQLCCSILFSSNLLLAMFLGCFSVPVKLHHHNTSAPLLAHSKPSSLHTALADLSLPFQLLATSFKMHQALSTCFC